MTKKWNNYLIIAALAFSVTMILQVTVISRIGIGYRRFYPLFHSYRDASVDSRTLVQNIENVILFVPVGIAIAVLFQGSFCSSLITGFFFSLVIESCQWCFSLGAFEMDDLMHNAIGAAIGSLLISKTRFSTWIKLENKKESIITFTVISICILFLFTAHQEIKLQEMRGLAKLNDREDGTENLLVLSPEPRYFGETDFSITYNNDGSIKIEGKAGNRASIQIGSATLDKGKYSFSGFSGIENRAINIELHYYDSESDQYLRLTDGIGSLNEAYFTLEDKTWIRVIINLFPGVEGSFLARPAIYRELF